MELLHQVTAIERIIQDNKKYETSFQSISQLYTEIFADISLEQVDNISLLAAGSTAHLDILSLLNLFTPQKIDISDKDHYPIHLSQSAWTYLANSISRRTELTALINLDVTFRTADATNKTLFSSGQSDLTIIRNLGNYPHTANMVRTARDMTKKGGLLVITTTLPQDIPTHSQKLYAANDIHVLKDITRKEPAHIYGGTSDIHFLVGRKI